MTTHVIYHGRCYDGFTAAWAAWRKLGDSARYIPAAYGDRLPDLPKNARVVIVDFSYPRPVLEDLRNRVESLTILDHHKTAEADLKDFPGAHFDMEHSGAYLAWVWFHGGAERPPRMVMYVEDRDLWRFQLQDSRPISAWVQSYDYDFEVWSKLADTLETDFLKCVSEGGAILRAKEQMVKQMADNARMQSVGGYEVPVANATCYFSEVGEELCIRHPSVPFAAYYLDRKDGKRQWGLRSRNGFDCSTVAKKLGGGGHPGAAGFVE
jgi:oligoribonuclease NrnB/cAMP/cGMP phosphodiesterase (DHH superfamily)